MPTTEEVRTNLAEIVNEVAGVPAEDVQLEKSFTDDLDIDSLSMVEIIYAAEEKFGVSIPDEEAKNAPPPPPPPPRPPGGGAGAPRGPPPPLRPPPGEEIP